MMEAVRNGAWAKSGEPLPYDAEVEYLESTGTQWIDTKINSRQSLKIRAVFETNYPESRYIYGVRFDYATITCSSGTGINVNYGYVRWGKSAIANVIPAGLVDITQDSSGVIVNGNLYSYDYTQTVIEKSGYTIALFAARNSLTTVAAKMVGKLYLCRILDNGVLICDFIPVRFTNGNGNSEGAMFDKVSGQLFRNAGNGSFIIGPDKTT